MSRRGNGLRVQEVHDESDPDAPVYAGGGALPGPGATLAGPTFAEWLDRPRRRVGLARAG